MSSQRLLYLRTHTNQGVKRRHRVLKDEADNLASNLAKRLFVCGHEVDSVQQNLTVSNSGTSRQETSNAERSERFTATTLADESHSLATFDDERHVANGLAPAHFSMHLYGEMLDFEPGSIRNGSGVDNHPSSVLCFVKRLTKGF